MKKILLLSGFLLSVSLVFSQASNKSYTYLKTDSVTVAASNKYKNASFFKRLFLGKNYRDVWSTPVTLPVFNLKASGLKITELGGGMQTKSLRLKDKNGIQWVLRTIDKDVEKALPKGLQGTLAQSVVQDMISGAHPYAPLVIPTLTKAIKVPAASPVFYFIPDDPAFGEHQKLFANTVCMLEIYEASIDNTDTKGTEKVLENLTDENDHLVIQQAVLRARLLDMLLGDWDRHADQWRWGIRDSADAKFYYAIPRDRDQAFFNSNGLLVKASRLFGMKHLVGFKDDLDKVKSLNYKAWNFDALFTNELDKNEWEQTIKYVQSRLADDVINTAVSKLPPPIYAISAEEFKTKLKSRRDDLMEEGMDYYSFLARTVTVHGSNDEEVFRVKNQGDKLMVSVFAFKDGKEERKIYERVFDEKETGEIVLNGLDGDDQFIVEQNTGSRIKLDLQGGEGRDVYDIKGKIRNKINDDQQEKSTMKKTTGDSVVKGAK